jgi:hypothetical protein
MWFRRQEQKRKLVESEQAILDANRAKKRVEARTPEVRAISLSLKDIRERNHFADQLRIIIERG